MTKRLVLAALLALVAAVPALAADQNPPMMYGKAPPAAAPGGWQGFYIGINGGGGWGRDSIDPLFNITGFGGATIKQPFANPSETGWLVGGHAGYNWQAGNIVGGLEIDYDAADLASSQSVPVGVSKTLSQTLSTKIDALASGRGRLGLALNQYFMFYGTAGVAWAHESATVGLASTIPGFAGSFSQTASTNQFGWVAGLGVEAQAFDRVMIRLEALHYGFGDATYAFATLPPILLPASAKTTVDVLRMGASYRF